ncbi:MAG: DUF1737 domain-containing protein [Verrucomicrobia bacterium]|nr:MAG: DUF1737 domain-containing protein [Verrucomicrobiota bacterium]
MKTMTVVDYCIVSGEIPKVLAEEVQQKIAEGWQPWGSVALSTAINPEDGLLNTQLCQPMVKYAMKEWE